MNRFTKKLLVLTMLFSLVAVAWADKGMGRKTKNKTVLNIASPASIKSSFAFNIKSGLTYKGSLLNIRPSVGSMITTSIVTYQKGNTTYIVPYKNKITVAEMGQGYAGMKLIIRKK